MNQKHLIIVLLAIILVILCFAISYTLLMDHTQYTSFTISESGTELEIPDDMSVKSNDSENGILVLENDNTIVVLFNSADKGLAPILAFAAVKSPLFGTEPEGNITIDNPVISGCSLDGKCNAVYIGNNATHDNMIVISKNKDIVSHIIDSIIWGKKEVAVQQNNNGGDSSASSQEPSSSAYKSDGTPMNSKKEVTDYSDSQSQSQSGSIAGGQNDGMSYDYIKNNQPNVVDGNLE